jgi:hypothetical protein
MESWFSAEYDTSNGIVIYDFQITEIKRNGWVECRMVCIHTQSIDGSVTNQYYDADIHDNTSHYMGRPYIARLNPEKGTLRVFKGDGTLYHATLP